MKVKELIQQLQTLDQNALVILSMDEEGNGFRPLFQVDSGFFNQYTSEFGGEAEGSEDKPAVLLWPS